MDRKRLVILGSVLMVVVGTVFWYVMKGIPNVSDQTWARTVENISAIHAYTQHVETETILSDRTLKIVGVYHVDRSRSQFFSFSTTTITIPGLPLEQATHSFTLANISLGNDVYTKIETESDYLKETIPNARDWRHFRKDAIPDTFTNIAISGPILDNLLLFSDNGIYLTMVGRSEDERGGKHLTRYTFNLSPAAPRHGGTLETLLGRIGDRGTIEVWVDPEVLMIHSLLLQGEKYRSHTTISNVNEVPPLLPPPEFP